MVSDKMFSLQITHAAAVLLLVVGFLLHTSMIVPVRGSDHQEVRGGGAESSITKLESERVQALLKGDAAFIERNYAADYITTGATGLVRNKAEVIADLKSGAIKYESMTHDDVKIRVYGNTVVVIGLDSVKGVDKGQDISGRRRFTRVWVKQDGRWRLVANHTTRVP